MQTTLDAGRLVGQHQHIFAQINRFLNVMGNENHSSTQLLPQFNQFVLQAESQFYIQLSVWLIHQQNIRLYSKGSGNDHPLKHTSGKFYRVVILVLGQSDHFQNFRNLTVNHIFGFTLHLQAKGNIFFDCQPGHGGVFLKNIRDIVFLGIYFLSIDQNLAGGQFVQTCNAVQKGGFSASGGSDDTEKFTAMHIKGNIVQNLQVTEGFAHMIHVQNNIVFIHCVSSLQRLVHDCTDFFTKLQKIRINIVSWSGQVYFVFCLDVCWTVGHDHDSVSQVNGFFNIVGNKHNGALFFFPDLHQIFLHQIAGLGVQMTEGFIHEQHIGFVAILH